LQHYVYIKKILKQILYYNLFFEPKEADKYIAAFNG